MRRIGIVGVLVVAVAAACTGGVQDEALGHAQQAVAGYVDDAAAGPGVRVVRAADGVHRMEIRARMGDGPAHLQNGELATSFDVTRADLFDGVQAAPAVSLVVAVDPAARIATLQAITPQRHVMVIVDLSRYAATGRGTVTKLAWAGTTVLASAQADWQAPWAAPPMDLGLDALLADAAPQLAPWAAYWAARPPAGPGLVAAAVRAEIAGSLPDVFLPAAYDGRVDSWRTPDWYDHLTARQRGAIRGALFKGCVGALVGAATTKTLVGAGIGFISGAALELWDELNKTMVEREEALDGGADAQAGADAGPTHTGLQWGAPRLPPGASPRPPMLPGTGAAGRGGRDGSYDYRGSRGGTDGSRDGVRWPAPGSGTPPRDTVPPYVPGAAPTPWTPAPWTAPTPAADPVPTPSIEPERPSPVPDRTPTPAPWPRPTPGRGGGGGSTPPGGGIDQDQPDRTPIAPGTPVADNGDDDGAGGKHMDCLAGPRYWAWFGNTIAARVMRRYDNERNPCPSTFSPGD